MIAIQHPKLRFHPKTGNETSSLPAPHFEQSRAAENARALAEQLDQLYRSIDSAQAQFSSHLFPAPPTQLAQIMDEMRDLLANYFLLKEMLDDDIALRFDRQASAIAAERSELYLDACELADEARDFLFHCSIPLRRRVESLQVAFTEFCQRLRGNEQAETDLIWRSMCEDIGVGD